MCWISKKIKLKIAKKPVMVYKILNRDYYSPVIKYQYRQNTTVYSYLIPITQYEPVSGKIVFCVEKALHSYKTYRAAIKSDIHNSEQIIVRAIIPEGAVYAINKENEVISNRLIVL